MTAPTGPTPNRIILLMKVSTYRAGAFLDAANKLGIEVIQGVDIPPELANQWNVPLGLQFDEPEQAVRRLIEFARERPVQAILSVDDSATVIAARASEALGLVHNSSQSAVAARNKLEMRRLMAAGEVPVPHFRAYPTSDDPAQIAAEVDFPCVIKPLLLSGSRGVMRANNPAEFEAAFRRLRRMLH
ncbi:MAG: ATP-grasp domain-containing protein, partial [Anaerolineae bacterium]|nr:ATP-grasp domain-containing protein [Anaerolineae bacterium]